VYCNEPPKVCSSASASAVNGQSSTNFSALATKANNLRMSLESSAASAKTPDERKFLFTVADVATRLHQLLRIDSWQSR
jgi:hypothetical protein